MRGSFARSDDSRYAGLGGRDVLIEAEKVVRIPSLLEDLQPLVLRRSVGLADPVGSLIAQKVDVDAPVPRLQRGPEAPHPLPLDIEARLGLGAAADVVRETGRAATERRVVVAEPADRAAQLPDRE